MLLPLALAFTNKGLAVDAITEAASCLQEQPGGMGSALQPWIVLPVWYGNYIQTSELKNASLSGDGTSLLRKSVQSIGQIGGFDIYLSNLLPKFKADEGKAFPHVTCACSVTTLQFRLLTRLKRLSCFATRTRSVISTVLSWCTTGSFATLSASAA